VLPGKKYKPEDFLLMAWRQKWVILIPTVLIAVGTVIYSASLPNRYRSESLILIVPQRVPENFVRPTVTADVDERLQSISQQILSRTRLERIILELNLYPGLRKTAIMEDVVDRMRRNITVAIDRPRRRNEESSSFRIGFSYENPRIAMQVAERVSSLFIEENLKDREILAEGTDQFLESQLEEARRQLLENEKRLEDYKRQHMGQLPTQTQSNLQVLQNSQQQLQAVSDAILRDRDQLVIQQRLLAEAEAAARTAGARAAAEGQDLSSLPAAAQLEAARNALAALRLRLKPEHPDLIRAERSVKELERRAAEEELAQPLSPGGDTTPRTGTRADARVAELRRQLTQLQAQITARQREETRLKNVIATYQARVEAAPARESELVALTRDYDTLRDRYSTLLSKREDAKIAANLERRQIGEQFKIVDAARLPERPESPDRQRMNLMGLVAGLGVGLALAALLEYRDTTLRTEDDVLVTLSVPVLALVPEIATSRERSLERKRRKWLSLGGAAVVAIAAVAAAAYRLGWLAGWV
jgi:polysaccharide chain length determinant protein (PEP-CTERM system associated)